MFQLSLLFAFTFLYLDSQLQNLEASCSSLEAFSPFDAAHSYLTKELDSICHSPSCMLY